MGHRNGDDGGAVAVEAALLLVGVVAVLLPVAFAVGGVVGASFDGARCPLAARSTGQECPPASSGGGGGQSSHGGSGGGTSDGGQWSTTQVESSVAELLGGSAEVHCPPVEEPPPPVGTEITCTATYSSGSTETVTVRFIAGGGLERVS